MDDTTAKAAKGVHQIVRLDDAIAVVADHMGVTGRSATGLSATGGAVVALYHEDRT